jgi:ESS family glutamate:Na+ symporter
LSQRHQLAGGAPAAPMVGLPYRDSGRQEIDHLRLMGALLAVHVAIILGYLLNELLEDQGAKLPLFVSCLMMGILLSNSVPQILPRLPWPARTPAMAVLADLSLNIFLAMSLMSMQLWTLAGLAGPLLAILALQSLAVFFFVIFVLFPLMGRDYEAAVLSSGFGGFALGATPTAVADMTAVTKQHGPAPNAFIILPLVAAFFVDLANAIIVGLFLGG